MYGAVVVALLVLRIPRIRQWVSRIRNEPRHFQSGSFMTRNVKHLPQ
jgi:hypothetical protein